MFFINLLCASESLPFMQAPRVTNYAGGASALWELMLHQPHWLVYIQLLPASKQKSLFYTHPYCIYFQF
jgi:hypothetical protein